MYANASEYHQMGTREEKETHMCNGHIFSFIVILCAILINGFCYAWKDPFTWIAIVLIAVEVPLFCCSYKGSMCDVDGRTTQAKNMRYFGYLLSVVALILDSYSAYEALNKDNE
eukprot:525445_1